VNLITKEQSVLSRLTIEEMLARNLSFLSFYMLPFLNDGELSKVKFELLASENSNLKNWSKQLVDSGFWRKSELGGFRVNQEEHVLGRQDSSLGAFLSLNAAILGQIDPRDPQCWYNIEVLGTNQMALKELKQTIWEALKRFKLRSTQEKQTLVISWSTAFSDITNAHNYKNGVQK
jgi:hypothetical protein